jgi:hypothetical protein
MKPIAFEHTASQKIYSDYIKRTKKMVSGLTAEDKQDVLMEFNSHIFESMQHVSKASEIDNLLDVLQKLGAPEDVLKPLVAEKKLDQATKTFNPLHVFKALVLNISNGVSYIIFALLYVMLFGFIFLIISKAFSPDNVGLFYKDDSFFVLGRTSYNVAGPGIVEVLGNWFIPIMIFVTISLYVVITLLLRLKRSSK